MKTTKKSKIKQKQALLSLSTSWILSKHQRCCNQYKVGHYSLYQLASTILIEDLFRRYESKRWISKFRQLGISIHALSIAYLLLYNGYWKASCEPRINENKFRNIHEAAFPSFHQQSPILSPRASGCNCLLIWQSPYGEYYVENPPTKCK